MSKKQEDIKSHIEIPQITWDDPNRIYLNGIPLLHTGDIRLKPIPGCTGKLLNITLLVEISTHE